MARPYQFRPVAPEDRALFDAWLCQPHIGGWWGESATEWALVEGDMAGGAVDMRIVEHDGIPFAFVQDYPAHGPLQPQYADLPEGARALDTFLGDPGFLGRGHGAAYLRARCDQLLERAPMVAVDPSPANTRAIAAYARAGFARHRKRRDCEAAEVLVMTRPAMAA